MQNVGENEMKTSGSHNKTFGVKETEGDRGGVGAIPQEVRWSSDRVGWKVK